MTIERFVELYSLYIHVVGTWSEIKGMPASVLIIDLKAVDGIQPSSSCNTKTMSENNLIIFSQ